MGVVISYLFKADREETVRTEVGINSLEYTLMAPGVRSGTRTRAMYVNLRDRHDIVDPKTLERERKTAVLTRP